jgi:hypothetical protein
MPVSIHSAASPSDLKSIRSIQIRQFKIGRPPDAEPNTTYEAPEFEPFGSAPNAPMIMSVNPSPLTSPAEAREKPLTSPGASAIDLKSVGPIEIREIDNR